MRYFVIIIIFVFIIILNCFYCYYNNICYIYRAPAIYENNLEVPYNKFMP